MQIEYIKLRYNLKTGAYADRIWRYVKSKTTKAQLEAPREQLQSVQRSVSFPCSLCLCLYCAY